MSPRKSLALARTGMLAAILAVLAQLALPMPGGVPLTLQTFAAALCAYLGGVRRGVPAVLVYLALGTVGVPVFAGFRGGFGVLLGPTGGFLWGLVLLALLCGRGAGTGRRAPALLLGAVGMALCHALGVLQYAAVSGTGLLQSFCIASLPYLLKDMLALTAAFAGACTLRRAMRRAGCEIFS